MVWGPSRDWFFWSPLPGGWDVRPVGARGTFSPREDGGAGEARRLCGGPAAEMRPPFSFFLKKRMRRARWKRKSLFAAQPALRASWRKCGGLPNRCRPDLPAFCRVRSTLAVVETAPPQLAGPRQSSWGGRPQGLSFYSRAFRFAMRCPAGYRKQVARPSATARVRQQKRTAGHLGLPYRQSPATARVRQQKEKQGASGNTPSFRNFHMWLSGQKPASPHRAKPP